MLGCSKLFVIANTLYFYRMHRYLIAVTDSLAGNRDMNDQIVEGHIGKRNAKFFDFLQNDSANQGHFLRSKYTCRIFQMIDLLVV
ncbi:hypothetical protein D3C77_641720 [compost metagenome]